MSEASDPTAAKIDTAVPRTAPAADLGLLRREPTATGAER